MPKKILPIAAARERACVCIEDLAYAIGINEPTCWDLMFHEVELDSLSPRQFINAASALKVSPLSLLPTPVAPVKERRNFDELAEIIKAYCAEKGITADQFGDLCGWNVQSMLTNPTTALDDWCLDCLRDVCATLGLHWPDFLPEVQKSA